MTNHYVELDTLEMGSHYPAFVCLEEIAVVEDYGGKEGVAIHMKNGSYFRCTESYTHVKALIQKEQEK